MKRSRYVPLVLLGTLSASVVTGCGERDQEVMQQSYASREDCNRDWGSDGIDCSASGGHGGGYVGPRYYWDNNSGRPIIVDPDGSTRVSNSSQVGPTGSGIARTASISTAHIGGDSIARGGFGESAHGFSLGG